MKLKVNLCTKWLVILAALSALNPRFSSCMAQGTAFTYEGRLNDGTNPANGNYDLQFTIHDALTNGTVVGGPISSAPTAANNGLFSVVLDFGAGVFTGPARWLEIGVRTNGSTSAYTQLAPRQELTPTPYAILAATAGTVTNGAISSAQIASGQVVKSLNGLSDALTISAGANVSLATNGNSLAISSTGGGAVFGLNGNNAYYTAGNVGIGTMTPDQSLTFAPGSAIKITDPDPSEPGWGTYLRADNAGNATLSVGGHNLTLDCGWNQTLQLGDVAFGTNGGKVVIPSGNFGIGTMTPKAPLDLQSGFGTEVLRFSYDADEHHSISTWYSDDPTFDSLTFNIDQGPGAGTRPIMTMRGNGHVGITDTDPQYSLDVLADVAGAQFTSTNSYYGSTIVLSNSTPNQASSGAIQFYSAGFSGPDGARTGIIACKTDGTMHFTVGGYDRMQVSSDGTVSVGVLQINGADLAEPFKVSAHNLAKGTVVIIDEKNPGELKVSESAYDKRVAGILSGANGVHTGICLKQQGFNDVGQNVALSGRVYALADASYGAIRPGDLLTTSDTPGHCMRVTDHSKAQGAIVGKAMSGLSQGKGMVLVLVSLQ